MLDALDLRILEILEEDGRRSYREIGVALGVAPGTARARVLQMIEGGVVEIVAVPNPHRMGLVAAIVGVRVAPGKISEAADAFARLPEVSWVALTANGWDIMIELILDAPSAFGEFKETVLPEIPGVLSAEIYFETELRKLRFRLAPHHESDRVTQRRTE